jgi:hypothetical protein
MEYIAAMRLHMTTKKQERQSTQNSVPTTPPAESAKPRVQKHFLHIPSPRQHRLIPRNIVPPDDTDSEAGAEPTTDEV